ncbi:3-carboxy-cis,cis-muconate cycloisomerase [uncultured Jannaschia sp.]|uniref:3-carboxy-cis,cis-muconate cycloisomerase n=1 Tax=uncultured Jannaschia sp. TaxID=293347 RepID=UPI0026359AE6|nr:3-carboxy-cis,cis-muconate cycloisomerase [uncultured Jannaschia sp.]
MTGIFDHPWLGGLFGDDEMADLWSPDAQMRHMLAFEAAWTRALGRVGRIDPDVADTTARAILATSPDIASLREGTARDGLPVPALVERLRQGAFDPVMIHTGSTSQDVLDTALVLTLRATSNLLDTRLHALSATLSRLVETFGEDRLMGRTRMQAALPITVADRIRSWMLPLEDHRARISRLRPIVERAQIGGAVGDRSELGTDAEAIVASVAAELHLAAVPVSWHAMRDGIAEYAGCLSLISGTLGKMGQDICLMAQQGVDEIVLTGGGGSSAMKHKQNPILAELLVTLARFNAVQVSAMHQALIHEQERSGAAWALEWMVLPQMARTTGRSLTAADALCRRIDRIGRSAPSPA